MTHLPRKTVTFEHNITGTVMIWHSFQDTDAAARREALLAAQERLNLSSTTGLATHNTITVTDYHGIEVMA